MGKLPLYLVLMCLGVYGVTSTGTRCKMCPSNPHPQHLYCQASYVLKIRPLISNGMTFTCQVLKVYKGDAINPFQNVTILTDCLDYFDGLTRKPFFITVKRPMAYDRLEMDSCDLRIQGRELTCMQRKGLTGVRDHYEGNCLCSGLDRCRSEDLGSDYCFHLHGYCAMGKRGTCYKRYNFGFPACLKEK